MDESSPIVGAAGPRLHRSPEERAVGVAIACSAVGAVVKLAAGAATGSMSMISSAVDSLGDLIVSLSNLFVVRYADRDPDEDHNYGHARIEGLGALFEGGFVFASGIFLVYEAAVRAVQGKAAHDAGLGILVMLPLLGLTIGTVLYLRRAARRSGSLVLRADALHYLTDVWVNLGVLLSLALVRLTGRPLVDTIVSIGLALFMMASSTRIMKEGFDVLMERSLDAETVRRVRGLLDGWPRIDSVHDLRTLAGKIPHVDFHVVVAENMTVGAVHQLFLDLRAAVRIIVGPSTRVLMHADPSPEPAGP